MNYLYKKLGRGDVAAFRQLLSVFGEAFEDADTYGAAQPSDAYLARLLAKPDFIVVVAKQNRTIAGGLVAYVLEKFEQDRREIYIYDLAVHTNHRRRGVATALIQQLQKIGKKLKACVIFVQADRGDTPAITLYKSLGKQENVYHFDIAVD